MEFSSSVLVSVFLVFVAATVVDATKPTRSKAAAACNSLVSIFSRRSREKPPVVCDYAKDHGDEYEPKNIVISFDGTGGHPEWAVQEENQEPKLYTNGQGLFRTTSTTKDCTKNKYPAVPCHALTKIRSTNDRRVITMILIITISMTMTMLSQVRTMFFI